MRFGILAAALVLPSPVNAATIIQTINQYTTTLYGGVQGFDPTLGTLNSVTLSVEALSIRRINLYGPKLFTPPTPTSVPFDWSVNSAVRFLFGSNPNYYDVPITGSGSTTVDIVPGADLFFETPASGSATLNLNPLDFMQSKVGFSRFDPGMYDFNYDTTVTSSIDYTGVLLVSDFRSPDDYSFFRGTLIYDYSPVPEPATWAMMLVGFGLAGAAMRRRKVGAAPSLQSTSRMIRAIAFR